MCEPAERSGDEIDRLGLGLFMVGVAVMFGAFAVGIASGYWGLPLWFFVVGGAMAAHIGMDRVDDGARRKP